jgi:hypothetical protein
MGRWLSQKFTYEINDFTEIGGRTRRPVVAAVGIS